MASNLNTTGNSLLNKASGSIGLNTAIIRNGANNGAPAAPAADTANALENLQKQVNAQGQALQQLLPSLQKFQVNDTSGSLIAWIGSFIVGMATYFGAWFRTLYIGGTSAANAPFVADQNGNITINGATITLNKNGVLTTISNSAGPDGLTDSLTSQDVSGGPTLGQLTAVNPFSFTCWVWDTVGLVYVPVANLRAAGGGGRVLLSKVNTGNSVLLATDGIGSPEALVTDSTNTSFMRPTVISSGGGFTASGIPGINASDSFISSISYGAGAVVTSISSSTSTISYTPGASTATFVDGIGATYGVAIDSFTPTTGSAGYTKGLRTS